MPIEFTIDHEKRFVHARVLGVIALKDIEDFTDAVAGQDALTYRKLFDGREGDGTYTDEDVMALAARAAAYASIAKRGPLALIPKPGMGAELAKRFVNVGKFTGEALARARTLFSVVYQPTEDGRAPASRLRLENRPLAAD